jgi:glutaconyl-CoA decarboxylase
MQGQPITSNPVLIMLINMTIVFSVLILLGFVMKLIHYIDPTKPKKQPAKAQAPAPAPAPAPVQAQAPVVNAEAEEMEEKTVRALITTAIMASGYSNFEITSIRKVD